jgi:hypothetical protein
MFWFATWQWDTVTGGEDGLAGVNRLPIEIPGLFSINLKDITSFYQNVPEYPPALLGG